MVARIVPVASMLVPTIVRITNAPEVVTPTDSAVTTSIAIMMDSVRTDRTTIASTTTIAMAGTVPSCLL